MTVLKYHSGDLITVNSLYYGEYIALYLHKVDSKFNNNNIHRVLRKNDDTIHTVDITEIELLARARYGGSK